MRPTFIALSVFFAFAPLLTACADGRDQMQAMRNACGDGNVAACDALTRRQALGVQQMQLGNQMMFGGPPAASQAPQAPLNCITTQQGVHRITTCN